MDLLKSSHETVWSSQLGNTYIVIRVQEIEAVVAMVPHDTGILGEHWKDQFFLVERPGMDVAVMGEYVPEPESNLDT
jgi:hypothetical protein